MFWKRFANLCEMSNEKPNPVAKKLDISSGTVTNWKSGTLPNTEALIKLSNYFNCSVDYLLGRVDTPNGTYSITGDNNVQINGNKGDNFTINNAEQSKKENRQDNITENFIKMFETLDFTDQVEAMKFVTDMTKK